MAGFDQDHVTVSAGIMGGDEEMEEGQVDHQQYKSNLKDFLMQYGEGQFAYKYRFA